MSELILMTELTDTELDAVCGGLLNWGNTVTQSNSATALNVSVFSFATAQSIDIAQANVSSIG